MKGIVSNTRKEKNQNEKTRREKRKNERREQVVLLQLLLLHLVQSSLLFDRGKVTSGRPSGSTLFAEQEKEPKEKRVAGGG